MRTPHIDLLLALLVATSISARGNDASPCLKSGEVFGFDPIAQSVLIKGSDGYISQLDYDDRTTFATTPYDSSSSKQHKLASSEIQTGDYVCAASSSQIWVVTRMDIARTQLAYLVEWQKGSVFGAVESVDSATGRLTVVTRDGAKATPVLAAADTIIRRYGPGGQNLMASPAVALSELKPGDLVDVRGTWDAAKGQILARAVVIGGGRSVAATLLSIDILSQTVLVRELATGRRLAVHVASTSLFRTLGPRPGTAMAKGPLMSRYEVASLGFADLQPGDSILLVGIPGGAPDSFTADLLVARFGYFVKPGGSVSADQPALWMLH